MDVREKLVEFLNAVQQSGYTYTPSQVDDRYGYRKDIPNTKVADHLIAHGVTVLPCKIGDVVWGIKKYNNGQGVKQGIVHQMFFDEDMRLCVCVKNVCRGEWGMNVFLTKDEAESHLPQPPKGE